MLKDIAGIILSGGKSKRMGQDKAFVPFSGKPLIEIVLDELTPLFRDLLIITNDGPKYEKYGLEIYPDILKDCGPLGGIYTGLKYIKSNYAFVVACDMPFLNAELITHMARAISGHDVVLAERGGRVHPLGAIYSRNCLNLIENQLQKGNFKIRDFFPLVRVKVIPEAEVAPFDENELIFANINTPEDGRLFEGKLTSSYLEKKT